MDITTITLFRDKIENFTQFVENLNFAIENHFVDTAITKNKNFKDTNKFKFHHFPLINGSPFDHARQIAINSIKTEWVLIVDTDEQITKEFIKYLRTKIDSYQKEGVNGVWVPRLNHVLGKPLNYSSEWPDYQLRLMRKNKVKFTNTIHKFYPDLKNIRWIPKDKSLAIKHYALENIESFIQRQNIYSTIESKYLEKNINFIMPLFFAFKDFVARYIRMKGFLDGKRGLHYALIKAFYRYMIYTKNWEMNILEKKKNNLS
tara:strand:- start:1079 stop:1858 length:780 start_codon:yes stop_codon:yes gene_type:complete